MGLFNHKLNREEIAEAKQRQFMREQDLMNGQANPQDELLHYESKQERNDLFRWQQDLSDELVNLRFRLKNYQRDGEGGWKPKKVFVGYDEDKKEIYSELAPMLNELGIAMVEAEVEPLLSRNLINSNLTEDSILKILKRTCRSIKNDLVTNFDLYQVNPLNPTTFSRIMSLTKNIIIPAPYRALGGWNKRTDNTVNKRLETILPNSEQPKRSGLFGIGGR